jgi:hypothetical protein
LILWHTGQPEAAVAFRIAADVMGAFWAPIDCVHVSRRIRKEKREYLKERKMSLQEAITKGAQ